MALTSQEFRFSASVPGYIGKQPFKNTGAEIAESPQYQALFPKISGNFSLVETLMGVEQGEISEPEMDEAIAELILRVKTLHPVLPLLLGEVSLECPEEHLPVSFKLNRPNLKALNDLYEEAGADDLVGKIQELVGTFFGASDSGEPMLTLLHDRDPKGGKAILNLKAAEFNGADKTEAIRLFKEKEKLFQVELTRLILAFDATHGNQIPAEGFEAQMLFGVVGAWDFKEGEGKPTTKDCVRHLLLSEHISNQAKIRHDPDFDRRFIAHSFSVPTDRIPGLAERKARLVGKIPRRSNVAVVTGRQYLGYLEQDLRRSFPDFLDLYREHGEDPAWEGIFETLEESSGDPFLSQAVLQSYRKGTLQQDFPVISDLDFLKLRKFIKVVNTPDVLKPFLGSDIDLFCGRLERMAALLQHRPQTQEEKKVHLINLRKQYRVNLKDRGREAQTLAHTLFAFCERMYEVLCVEDGSTTGSIYIGDIGGLGASNIFCLLKDVREFFEKFDHRDDGEGVMIANLVREHSAEEVDKQEPQLLPALVHLLETAGDHVTRIRRVFDARLSECLGSDNFVNSVDTGDELVGASERNGFEEGMLVFLKTREVRMAVADLGIFEGEKLEVEEAAHLFTCLLVFAGGLTKPMKQVESRTKTMADTPVKIRIRR